MSLVPCSSSNGDEKHCGSMIWLNLPQALCCKSGTSLPPGKSWIVSDPSLSGLKLLSWKKVLIPYPHSPEIFHLGELHQNWTANYLSTAKDTAG